MLKIRLSRRVFAGLAATLLVGCSRPYQVGPKTISYEVVLDVIPGVFAYGILTLPKDLDLTSGEKRPVVVCYIRHLMPSKA